MPVFDVDVPDCAERGDFVFWSESARGRVLAAVDPGGAEPEEVRLLYAFIGGLDPLHKALMLLYLDGFSYGEIAATLGISETNVATKSSRMKQRNYGT